MEGGSAKLKADARDPQTPESPALEPEPSTFQVNAYEYKLTIFTKTSKKTNLHSNFPSGGVLERDPKKETLQHFSVLEGSLVG